MDSEGKEAKLFTFKGIVFRGDNRPPKVIQKAGGFRSKNNLSDTKNIQEAQGVGIAKGATATSGVSCADQFTGSTGYFTTHLIQIIIMMAADCIS